MATFSDTSQHVTFTAKLAEIGGQVHASIVVRFPPESRIRNQHVASVHPDRAAAEAWIVAEAKRRGLTWAPDK